jgi:hypothetical protein
MWRILAAVTQRTRRIAKLPHGFKKAGDLVSTANAQGRQSIFRLFGSRRPPHFQDAIR